MPQTHRDRHMAALRAQSGTLGYVAGTGGGEVALTSNERPISIFAYAQGSDGTLTIDGGDAITVRSGVGVEINLPGVPVNPTVVFSASLDYTVFYLTG